MILQTVFGSGHIGFPCPLLLTSIHFGTQWLVSSVLGWVDASCNPQDPSLGTERVTSMSWSDWLRISVPCGFVTSADIGLSNLSLVSISITFYTMVKASTPIFLLTWAYIFGIERITWSLILVVAIIAAGEFLTVVGEVDFQLVGFLLCLTASMLSGMRWTLVQLKLQTMDPPLKSTLATMRLLSPSMFWSMLLLSIAIEQPWNKFEGMSVEQLLYIMVLGFSGAFLAIAMILCEFYLIMQSSAIILMMGGVIKELITIMVGVFYFGDKLNRVNVAGCVIVFLGVIIYKVMHFMDKKAKEEGNMKRSASSIDRHAGIYKPVALAETTDEPLGGYASEAVHDLLRQGRNDSVMSRASDSLAASNNRLDSAENSRERSRSTQRALELEPVI